MTKKVKCDAPTPNDPTSKWEAAAWELEGPVIPLRAPFHILAGEALDVARFCKRNWYPLLGHNDEVMRPGLSSAVGNGTFTGDIAQEIIELHAALQAAQTRYRLLITGADSQPMERAQFVLGELRSTLKWFFGDGKTDDSDARLDALNVAHDGAISQDAVAAALFDYAELADRHRRQISGLGGFEEPLIDEARALGTELRELSAGPAAAPTPHEDVLALELRNRIGALLYDRMQRVRSAARFVFRRQPELVRQVTSAYARRQRATHRARHGGDGTPEEPAPPGAGPAPDGSQSAASSSGARS